MAKRTIEVENLLQQLRQEREVQIKRLRGAMAENSRRQGAIPVDDAIQVEVLNSSTSGDLQRLTEEFHDIVAALRKIDEGRYGLCDHCGESIAPARLEAQPWASNCRACQETIEKEAEGLARRFPGIDHGHPDDKISSTRRRIHQ